MLSAKDLKTDGEKNRKNSAVKKQNNSVWKRAGHRHLFICLFWLVGSWFLIRDWIPAPTVNALSPNHWTTRDCHEQTFYWRRYRWMISTWKDAELHESLGNAKPHWNITAHLSKKLKKIKNKKSDNPKCWKDVEKLAYSHTAGGNVNQNSYSGKGFGSFLTKLNIQLLYDLHLPSGTEKWQVMFLEVGTQCSEQFLTPIALNQKQPRCPSVDEWINKLCSGHTMKYYSVIKKIELVIHIIAWMHFQRIMLSEKNYAESIPKLTHLYNILEMTKL